MASADVIKTLIQSFYQIIPYICLLNMVLKEQNLGKRFGDLSKVDYEDDTVMEHCDN